MTDSILLIPYYARSHRGNGEMAVWLPSDENILKDQLKERVRISDKVFARDLLPVAEQVAQFTEIGLSVASFDETDEYYYILLQRVGRKLSASVADAIY